MSKESILDEAKRLVHGDRQKAHGHPRDNFEKVARFWTAFFNNLGYEMKVKAEDVPFLMMLFKMAREQSSPSRENRVDIAGYDETLDMLYDEPENIVKVEFPQVIKDWFKYKEEHLRDIRKTAHSGQEYIHDYVFSMFEDCRDAVFGVGKRN